MAYKIYTFDKKDPVIYIAKTCIQIFAVRNNLTFNAAMKQIEKACGVRVTTMRGWFYGATHSPLFCNVVRVVHATGRDVVVSGKNVVKSRARFRVAA